MMREGTPEETQIDLGDTDISLEDDLISTQSDTRPLLNERDPRGVNECLKVTFEDVIAEPQSVRSTDKVWICSHTLFEVSKADHAMCSVPFGQHAMPADAVEQRVGHCCLACLPEPREVLGSRRCPPREEVTENHCAGVGGTHSRRSSPEQKPTS